MVEELARLRAMGVRLSLDDFGTGYSSLSYLKRFRFDILKIDRSFVAGVPDRPDDVSVVNAIFAMARGLDLKVVAEGVERRAQLDFIRAHRCDFVQGWLFSKALDEATYKTYLEGANAGALFVRADSGITDVKQLRGKTVIFGGGRDAMMSYIAPRYLLMRAGIGEGEFKTEFAVNPPNALLALYHRQADAAGGGDILIDLPAVRNSIDAGQVKVLAATEPLLFLPWAVKRSMSAKLADEIQALQELFDCLGAHICFKGFAVGFAGPLGVDDHGAVGTLAGHAAGRVGVVGANLPVRGVAVDHGVHVAGGNAEESPDSVDQTLRRVRARRRRQV